MKKIHRIAKENSSADTLFLLLGDRDHPEVDGIVSYAGGEVKVFASADELFGYFEGKNIQKRIIMAAQTTQKLSEWEKCQKNIKKLCTNGLIFDTICSVTEDRQTEVEKMAREMDAMIVIGGRNSSNTAKLYAICQKYCAKSIWVESVEEIPSDFCTPHIHNVGIAAGASTPSGIIQEVYVVL